MEFRLIKTKSKDTYKDKNGKERHYYNIWVELPESGKRIQIRAAFDNDKQLLSAVAKYVG